MFDVAVIGGGPAGSRAAAVLAGLGHDVIVLEKKADLSEPVCCTGIISEECAAYLKLEEDIVFRHANSAVFFSPGGKQLRLQRNDPQVCIVDRPAFNAVLAQRAKAKGADYRLNTLVNSINPCRDSVRLEAVSGDGKHLLEARAVIIATGSALRLVDGLRLGRPGSFALGAQIEVDNFNGGEVEIYFGQQVAPAFFGWLVPTSATRALVGLLSRRNPGAYLKSLIARLAAQGKVAGGGETTYGVIPLQPLRRTFAERILVIGGAAGHVKPTTGGGVYYSLLGADIAAAHLHRALLDDDFSARRLAAYEADWKRKLGKEFLVGAWARRIYEHLSDGQIDSIFDIISTNGIHEALVNSPALSFDWHGGMLVKLLHYKALAKFGRMIKAPFVISE